MMLDHHGLRDSWYSLWWGPWRSSNDDLNDVLNDVLNDGLIESEQKLLTIIANDRCGLFLFEKHPNELYSEREKAVRYFQDKCPKDFDLYGDYWPDDLKKCWKKKWEVKIVLPL